MGNTGKEFVVISLVGVLDCEAHGTLKASFNAPYTPRAHASRTLLISGKRKYMEELYLTT